MMKIDVIIHDTRLRAAMSQEDSPIQSYFTPRSSQKRVWFVYGLMPTQLALSMTKTSVQ